MQNEQAFQALEAQQETSKHGESEHSSQMNIETNVNLTKKKRIIFWVYLLTILAFLISIIILSVYSWTPTNAFTTTDNYYYASQVANDWSSGFIVDVKVVNGNTTSCPNGYANAFNFAWPGTVFGCFCNINSNMSFVLEGYCAPGLIQQGCQNMPRQQTINASNWRNQGLICIKRSSVSFATQSKYNGNNNICGSSQSLVIMPNGSPCPFVNISFSSFTLEDHQLIASDIANISSPIYLTYNSTSPYSFYSYPITKFAVSQYQFCQMDTDSGLDPGHSDFTLLNIVRGCAGIGNYSLLDSMTEILFYQNNQKLNALSSLAGFPQPGNWKYKFGFASLTGWTYKCRHTYNNKFSIPNAINQFNFVYLSTYRNFLIGITVCLVIIVLQLIVIILRRIINNAVYPVGYKQKYLLKHFLLALSRYVVDISAKLAIFSITLVNLFTIYTNYNWFVSAVNLNCPDGNFSTLFNIMNPFMKLYQLLFYYSLATLIICIAMLIIDLIHFIYIYKNQLTFYLIQTQDKQMIKKEEDDQLKWIDQKQTFEQKDIQLNINKDENDQFRITMAQNIFSREDSDPQPQKLKKKKKKKISPLRRKDQESNVDFKNDTSKLIQGESLQFNPYVLQDQSLEKLDSPQGKYLMRSISDKKKRKK